MAVLDAEWWAVWWPWMLVWLTTLAAVVTAVAAVVRGWLTNRGRGPVGDVPSAPLYLDKAEIIAMYLASGGVLRQEIERTFRQTADATLSGELANLAGSVGRSKVKEVISRYVDDAEPLTVIRAVREALENAHAIVRVHLTDREVTDNRALANAARGTDTRGKIHLTALDTEYVLLRGKFRRVGAPASLVGFTAPYGTSAGPRVVFQCREDDLLLPVPAATFKARCLCHVDEWNPAEQTLSVRPIAFYL